MARRKGGKSQRFKKPQGAPAEAATQAVDAEAVAPEVQPAAPETPAETVTETPAETPTEQPTETPATQPSPSEEGGAPVDPEETGPEAVRPDEPETPEPSPEQDEAPAPEEPTGEAALDPAGADPVDTAAAVVAPPEPQRPAAHVVEASTAAYGPEAVTPADLAVGREGVPSGHVEGKAAWRRLFRMSRPRTTKANVLGALLAIALGVGIATQVQLTNERGLTELSQSDLIRLLDDISARSSRLDAQLRELESRREKLLSGTDSAAEALQQAQRRADTLGILAGTLPAEGPGITVSISDPSKQVSGPVVLDLVQELRDAGAESIDVGGVRVVASSYVGDNNGDLSVDGKPLSRPILVKAIGDSNTLASAMTIPGGIVETIRQKGANASVNESRSIEITSTHTPAPLTHAEPGK
ncbi:DUF881 domain-containing protein [Intrasporangium sp.]|uniref:DUF881 domain-containing protein n=1 Tax=Intrasporangium sp. TaxID=1925024 RepID=UPI0033658FE8